MDNIEFTQYPDDFPSFCRLKLKDGNFEFTKGSKLFSYNKYTGNYVIKDSIMTLTNIKKYIAYNKKIIPLNKIENIKFTLEEKEFLIDGAFRDIYNYRYKIVFEYDPYLTAGREILTDDEIKNHKFAVTEFYGN